MSINVCRVSSPTAYFALGFPSYSTGVNTRFDGKLVRRFCVSYKSQFVDEFLMCTIDNMAVTCVTNLAPILDLKTADSTICRTGRSPLKCTICCTLVQLISTHVVSFMSVLFRYRQTRRPHHDLNTSLPISSRHSPPVPVLCLSLYIPYLAGNRPAPWRASPSAASWCLPSLRPGAGRDFYFLVTLGVSLI